MNFRQAQSLKGWMYILECSDGSYYVGSTNNIQLRIEQHQNGEGANHTKKRLPVTLVYLEEFERIDEAFYREKQVQGWNRKKKEALINNQHNQLPNLSLAYRDIVAISNTEVIEAVSRASTTEFKALPSLPDVVSSASTTDFIQIPALPSVPEALEGKEGNSIEEDNG